MRGIKIGARGAGLRSIDGALVQDIGLARDRDHQSEDQGITGDIVGLDTRQVRIRKTQEPHHANDIVDTANDTDHGADRSLHPHRDHVPRRNALTNLDPVATAAPDHHQTAPGRTLPDTLEIAKASHTPNVANPAPHPPTPSLRSSVPVPHPQTTHPTPIPTPMSVPAAAAPSHHPSQPRKWTCISTLTTTPAPISHCPPPKQRTSTPWKGTAGTKL
jgi:hypothetical protein